MTARTPYEYPLAAHAADADAALTRDELADEIAREATAWLEVVDEIEANRSSRNVNRLQEYMRATHRDTRTWDGPA